MPRHFLPAFAVVLCAWSLPAHAVPAFSFTGGTPTSIFVNRTFGYEFSTDRAAVVINSLGVWDQNDDGLAESHEVGIWSADGSVLLASAVVPAGTVATLDGGFRYVPIAPIVLPGSTSFLAGAFTGSGADQIIRFTTATETPGFILGSTRFDPLPFTNVFTAPTGTQGTTFDDGYFGPNFNGAAAALDIPEPATATLGLLALAGLTLRRRRAA